jgi:hypothetical protein
MTDPTDRRRTVWVRADDRADFESRGFEPVDSDEQRKAARLEPAADPDDTTAAGAAASAAEEESSGAEAPPAAPDDSDTAPTAPAPTAVSYPRRARRSNAAG